MGLYQIVDRLLQEGANPDGINGNKPSESDKVGLDEAQRYSFNDGETPLMIVLQNKFHGKDL